MSKAIKMVAVIDGEEISVGRCHAGQARILRKKGLADWKDGKIVFKSPKVVVRHPHVPDGWAPHHHVIYERKPDGTLNSYMSGLLKELEAEIDPDGELLNPTYVPLTSFKCETLEEWCVALAAAKGKGHDLMSLDDPHRRMIGFIDHTDDTLFEVGLSTLKRDRADADAVAPLGITLEEFNSQIRTQAGRQRMIRTPIADEQPDPNFVLPPRDELSEILWGNPEEDLFNKSRGYMGGYVPDADTAERLEVIRMARREEDAKYSLEADES